MEAGKTAQQTDLTLGWIGTGVMGQTMASHLLKAGFQLRVHNRTKEKAAPLIAQGAQWADSPKELANHCQIVFTMLGYPSDVREVILDESGLLQSLAPGSILVDMTTSEPSLAQEIATQAQSKGLTSLDAPVSGGDIGARQATLSIMIGGDQQAVDFLQPCWQAMGKTIVHQGPAGAGQHAKMVNQTLVAAGMVGVCEALLYAYRAGLNLEATLQSVSSGAAGSWALTNLAPRIIAGDFQPGFFVDHFIKDMGIALSEARRLQISLPGLALAQQLYLSLQANGHGKKGTQALQLALAQISGLDWQNR